MGPLPPLDPTNPSQTHPNDQVTPAINVNGDVKTNCGNGIVEGFEECDDRNNVDGDGCSSNCHI